MNRIIAFIILIASMISVYANEVSVIVKYDSRSKKAPEKIALDDMMLEEMKENPHANEQWRLFTRKVVDCDAFEKLIDDSITKYEKIAEEINSNFETLNQLQRLLGKKFRDDNQKRIVSNLITQLAATQQIPKKELEEISKDFNNGKVSKKLKNYLPAEVNRIKTQLENADRDVVLINGDWKKFYTSKHLPGPQPIYYIFTDTIENPYYVDFNYGAHIKNPFNYYERQIKNPEYWELFFNEELAGKSHPEYKFVQKYSNEECYAFDKNGELLSVVNPDWYVYRQFFNVHYDDGLFLKIAIEAYRANERNIQSAGKQATHYVKNQLGLEKLTAAEERASDAAAKAVAGFIYDGIRYGTKSMKGKAAQRKHAAKIGRALMSDSNGYFSDVGSKWLSQMEEDYWKFFADRKPFMIERVDNTTFKITYADANFNPTFELTYKYYGTGNFEAEKEITVKKLFAGPAYEYESIPQEYGCPLPCAENHNIPNLTKIQEEYKSQHKNSEAEEPVKHKDDDKVFDAVEQSPQFPGGEAALLKYVACHIRYPSVAKENGIQGRVTVQFVITKTGSIGRIKMIRGINPNLDREAIRVVKSLPKFTPGKMNGRAVNVWHTLPITFRLESA